MSSYMETEWMEGLKDGQLVDQLEVLRETQSGVTGGPDRASSKRDLRQQPHTFASAKIRTIPLTRIHITEHSLELQKRMKQRKLPELVVADEIAALGVMLCPPVVVADPQRAGDYLTVDDGRVVQWLMARLAPDEAAKFGMPTLVVDVPSLSVDAVAAIRGSLMPVVLGTLSSRDARVARKQLKDVGIARPRNRGRRQQLGHLVKR